MSLSYVLKLYEKELFFRNGGSILIVLLFWSADRYFRQEVLDPVVRPRSSVASPSTTSSIQFIAAGIPYAELGSSKNWTSAFSKLSASNINIFLPTFQFEEVPEAKSFGHEVDFLTLCTEPHLVHKAMKEEGVKLLLPLEVWYPSGDPLPALADDPLTQFIACVGREQITGVTLYDEAIHVGVPLQKVKELYERVKLVDPTLPVLMVHAYVTADSDGAMTETERRNYFEEVVAYSEYADIVGFDAYAIPVPIAKISTPYASGAEVPYDVAIEDYLLWLEDRIPEKPHLMVYQAFSFADQYSQDILKTLPQELVDSASIAPTQSEIDTMVSLAQKYNIAYVAWWGQSFLQKDIGVWESILRTTKSLKK
jgi:hypothetical protein